MPVLRPLARIWTSILIVTALTLALGLVARWLSPHAPWIVAPALLSVAPADGAGEVLPRSPIRLDFSQPMNRQSTEDALQITPDTPGSLSWSADSRSLTFQPEQTLLPDAAYSVSLAAGALGAWWRPIDRPRSVGFRTAPLPAVVAALPSAADTPLDGSIAIIFSQPMVADAQVGPPARLPQLRFDPPLTAQLRWLDPSTLLVRPDQPLRAATRYRGLIAADLADRRGIDLGQPYSWSWSTAWPEPRERSPADSARWVSPRQPLVLTLSAPLEEALLRDSLTIEPPIDGSLSAASVGATQVITFTPRPAWAFGRSYRVSLAPAPDAGLAAPPDLRWRFTVEPAPGLIAFVPGQGQALPPGGEIRLIFSTPMDADALRAGLRVDPPVPDLPLEVRETEVRLRPELRPSSAYTITIDASTPDRSGEPLGITATVRLRTAPAAPAMGAPAAAGTGVISLPISQTASVDLKRINIKSLDLRLYRLDAPTSVRAINLAPREWSDFQPERYGQALLRSWQIGLGDPPDTLVQEPLAVSLGDDAPLPPGVYYLRISASEGPRSDLLLVVSSVNLTLRQSDREVLIWATDRASGAPLADLPLALYAGDALVTRGQTGPDGVWAQPLQRPERAGPYLALAEGPLPSLVRDTWRGEPAAAEPVGYRSLIFVDRPSYRPGERVQIGGLSREIAADGALALPAAGAPCRMRLDLGPGAPSPAAICTVSAGSGLVSGGLALPADLPPASYRLLVSVGASVSALDVRVEAAESPAQLRFIPAADGQVAIRAERDGLPLAGATISWTLQLAGLPAAPDPAGFRFGDPPPAPAGSRGAGEAADDGQIVVPLPDAPAGGGALHYRLRADLRALGEAPASAEREGLIRSADPRVGLRLPQPIVLSDQRARVELQTQAADGSPLGGVPVRLAIYRADRAAAAPLLVRSAASDRGGRAQIELVQLNPGQYRIVASSGGGASQADLWVVGGRFNAWDNPPGQVAVIADRASYQPGDVASLLVTSPYTEANLLLTSERGSLLTSELRRLRAGQLITLTITPEMVPGVRIGALLASGDERLVGSGSISVIGATQALTVGVSADRQEYAPGESAMLRVASTIGGAPAAAELLITIAPAAAPPTDGLILAQFALSPPPMAAALLPPLAPAGPPPAPEADVAGGGYLVRARGGAGGDGQLVASVPLPETGGRWRISAYALASDGQLAIGSTLVSTGQPLTISPTAPPALHPGDRAEAGLLIRSSSALTQSLRVSLQAPGGTIDAATPADQQIILAPGGSQRLRWLVGPRPGASVVNLRYLVGGPATSQRIARDLPVVVGPPPAAQALTLVGSGSLSSTLGLAPPPAGAVELAVAPSLAAALADSAAQLAALPERSVEQRAGLLLIAAGLARSGPADEGERWAAVARAAAAELAAAQQSDGGWGWWPDTPSRPFVSAFAVEAQLAAAGLADGPSRSALAYLARAGAGLDPDAQAYLLYVRARASGGDQDAARALLQANLGPDGLAYLALALPPAEAIPAIERLLALAVRPAAPAPLSWQARGPAAVPRGHAAVSAAAIQALRVVQPLAAERAAGARALLGLWGVDGWASPFDAARVAAALPIAPAQEPSGPRRIRLGGLTLLDRATPISATQRLLAPAASLSAGAALAVDALGGTTYMVALRAAAPPAAAQTAAASRIAMEQSYVDPQSGAPLSLSDLRLGQLVSLRVTLVVARPLLRATLAVDLPAALQPIELRLRPPFIHAPPLSAGPRSLGIDAVEIGPGVYTIAILARVSAIGQFAAPAPRLIIPDEPDATAVAPPLPALVVSR